MLHAMHGHLASKNENKRQKNIWTVVRSHDRGHIGQGGLVLVCWASVLTHRSWCGDYTHTHACTRTACMQHSHEHMHHRTHATLTCTHAATHARNTHTHTCMRACTHQYTTRPTHTLTLKCSTYTCMRTHQALTDTYTTRWFPRTGWSLVAPA